MNSRSGLGRVDHLVWSTPDLDAGIRQIERLTGVRAIAGGSHPGVGTRNALLSLGALAYLEIIGPDSDQSDYRIPRVFQLDNISEPRLVTWAANTTDLAACAGMSFPDGQSLGPLMAMSRRRADGMILEWEMTDPYVEIDDGVVPFMIDWADTPHPAESGPQQLALVELHLRHPNPQAVREKLSAMCIAVTVAQSIHPELIAIIDSPRGQIELR
ncbi:MAG: VOC family protein [Gammaproteobacteria bacterium]|nr:VOC family protein [Gammaproteobacteria bacterium]